MRNRILKSFIKPIVQANNCTKQDSTSFSPYYLMFGREPNLPIDIILDNNTQVDTTSKSKYIESLKDKSSVFLQSCFEKHTGCTSKAEKK